MLTRFKTGKGQGLMDNRLLIRSLSKTTSGQLICKLQVFDAFLIVGLCLRCGGGRNSEDEIDR